MCSADCLIAAHGDWLTVVRLPPYGPELNPVEGVRANLKNGLGNFAVRSVDQLAAVVQNRFKRVQYRPELINGFVTQTGLSFVDKARNQTLAYQPL